MSFTGEIDTGFFKRISCRLVWICDDGALLASGRVILLDPHGDAYCKFSSPFHSSRQILPHFSRSFQFRCIDFCFVVSLNLTAGSDGTVRPLLERNQLKI